MVRAARYAGGMGHPLLRPGRRAFLVASGAVAAGAILPRSGAGQPATSPPPTSAEPGAPAKITPETIEAAEALAGISFTPPKREMLAKSIGAQVEGFRKRQAFPLPPNDAAPASRFDPRLPGMQFASEQRPLRTTCDSTGGAPALPTSDEDLAFAPVTDLTRWIRSGKLTSRRMTDLYLDRLATHDEKLKCVITLMADAARARADAMDAELKAGKSRGPLHGIPWGAKDLFDTAGVKTTWGAEPYLERIPTRDAAIVQRLEKAGAVLVAKLTLGALAMGDVWYGGRTNNPWNVARGSSGSSAGCGAAVAAGLVGFGVGTETWGSIVSPSVTCGCVGLRPTFGRVARTGAMALCWSLDKVGPMARSAEDTALVLAAINGADAGDVSSIQMPFNFDATRAVEGLKIGICKKWMDDRRANKGAGVVLDAAKKLGMSIVEFEMPDLPYDCLEPILLCEAAASFETLTRTGDDDKLKAQHEGAWPNTFRKAWFIPGIEVIQADRLRRQVMVVMNDRFKDVHAIIDPSSGGLPCGISNFTGHPSLTIRAGFRDNGLPHGVSLLGRLFDEGTICSMGMAIEKELGVREKRPTL